MGPTSRGKSRIRISNSFSEVFRGFSMLTPSFTFGMTGSDYGGKPKGPVSATTVVSAGSLAGKSCRKHKETRRPELGVYPGKQSPWHLGKPPRLPATWAAYIDRYAGVCGEVAHSWPEMAPFTHTHPWQLTILRDVTDFAWSRCADSVVPSLGLHIRWQRGHALHTWQTQRGTRAKPCAALTASIKTDHVRSLREIFLCLRLFSLCPTEGGECGMGDSGQSKFVDSKPWSRDLKSGSHPLR